MMLKVSLGGVWEEKGHRIKRILGKTTTTKTSVNISKVLACHSELFKVAGGYVADTPGFSSFDVDDENELILKDDLPYAFKEFRPFLGECKFTTCLHMKDKGCRIVEAVESGEIPESRHESYCAMMEKAKNIKEWELKNYKK